MPVPVPISDCTDEMPAQEIIFEDHESGRTMEGALERGFLEAALDAIVIVDEQGRVVEFNPSAEQTFGYLREEVVGQALSELIVPPSLRDRHQRAFDRFVTTRQKRVFGQRIELTAMGADRREFPVELTLSKVEGEPLLICGAIRDLSEEKQLKDDLRRLAHEQAALRQVATLVAQGASPTEVFSAVAEGVAEVLGVPGINMIRFDSGSTATKIAGWGIAPFDLGSHFGLDDPSVIASVARAGRPARIDNYVEASGPFAEMALEAGLKSGIGTQILVDGTAWGAIIAYSAFTDRFSDDAESRLSRFTELVATAISNMQALDRLHDLVAEQAALRRVATLVARATDPQEIFDAACGDMGEVLGASRARVVHYTAEGFGHILGGWWLEGAKISWDIRSLSMLTPSRRQSRKRLLRTAPSAATGFRASVDTRSALPSWWRMDYGGPSLSRLTTSCPLVVKRPLPGSPK